MYLIVYIIYLVFGFTMTIMCETDRVFGIAGILIDFLGAANLFNDNSLVINTVCDPTFTPCTWTNQTISGNNLIGPLFILGIFVIMNILILWQVDSRMKREAAIAKEQEES